MGEGAEQAQRIDCLLEEGRNAETILQHTKKQVFIAKKGADRDVLVKTSGCGGQSRVEKAAESLPQVEDSLNLNWFLVVLFLLLSSSLLLLLLSVLLFLFCFGF